MQLPPISRDASYCFNSMAWKNLDFDFVKLTQIERQKEKEMADFLNNVRFKTFGSAARPLGSIPRCRSGTVHCWIICTMASRVQAVNR